MIEITPSEYWCNSCDEKENTKQISYGMDGNNRSSFTLCETCLELLAELCKRELYEIEMKRMKGDPNVLR